MISKIDFITWLLDNHLDHIAGSVLLKTIKIDSQKLIITNNKNEFYLSFQLFNNPEFQKVAPQGCAFIFESNKWKIQNISTKQVIELSALTEVDKTNLEAVFNSITEMLH